MLSTDTREDADAAVATLSLKLPVLYDSDAGVAKSWGVFNLLGDGVAAPSLFVFDATGELRAFRVGRNAGDRPGAPEVLEVVRSFARQGAAAATATPGTASAAAVASATPPTAAQTTLQPAGLAPLPTTPAPAAVYTSTLEPTPAVAPPVLATATRVPLPSATPLPTPAATPAPTRAPAVTAQPLTFSAPLSDFTLPDASKGGQVRLGQYLGKKNVVLVFYRAYW